MQVAFVLWCRNKAPYIERSARCLFEQTLKTDLIFADHSSTDGSYEILCDLAAEHQRGKIMRCPLTNWRGILGLNAHMAWVMRQLTHEIIISASADDYNDPTRAEKVLAAFLKAKPDYVMTRVRFMTADNKVHETPSIGGDGFVPLGSNLMYQFGLQSGGAWTRELWEKVGPMRGIEAPDLILPCMAAAQGGLYMVDEALHEAINVADPHGVSTERAIQAAQDEGNDADMVRLVETNQYQFTSSHISLLERLGENNVPMNSETVQNLQTKLIVAARGWAHARDRLSLSRLEPKGLQV
jgi:hypothetical protein